jgi:cell division protein FtsB
MFDFQQKRQIKKVVYSRMTILVLFILLIFLAKATYDIYQREQLSIADYGSVKKQYDDLESRQALLNNEIAQLSTQAGVEEQIRDRFSVAKPGEEVITVVDQASTTMPSNTQNEGLWQKFTGLF